METIKEQKEVKARKIHTCNFCGQKIKIGEIYNSSTHKFEGDIYDWKSHLSCGKIASRLNMYEDCDEGLDCETFQEIISETYYQLLVEQIPTEQHKHLQEVLGELHKVKFIEKLKYVIKYYIKLDNL